MVADGKTVKVHYTGTLQDGTVFDSSKGREPLEFEVGSGQVIPGFENAVRDMVMGTPKTVTIPCDQAYGNVRDEMIAKVPRSQFPDEIDLEVGLMLQLQTPQGELPVRVTEVEPETATIDGNHPLAGQDLTFELEVVDVA